MSNGLTSVCNGVARVLTALLGVGRGIIMLCAYALLMLLRNGARNASTRGGNHEARQEKSKQRKA